MKNFLKEEYLKAGRIAYEVRESLKKEKLLGKKIIDVCNMIEERIRIKGGQPAFPCNLCINDIAAHYTPNPKDNTVIKEGDVVKIDFGVQINGFIADTAITFSFNPKYELLLLATEKALMEAIKIVKDQVKIGDIGKVIQSIASMYNYKPISNLTGHSIEQYNIHAGKSIPNIWIPSNQTLKKGEVYAIEPFLTDGAGLVKDEKLGNIYALISRRRLKEKELNEFLEFLWERFKTLPFTPRWIDGNYEDINFKIMELVKRKVLRAYPILREVRGGIVAQAEHTLVPTEEGCIILTGEL